LERIRVSMAVARWPAYVSAGLGAGDPDGGQSSEASPQTDET
jgi:hypothetical protein